MKRILDLLILLLLFVGLYLALVGGLLWYGDDQRTWLGIALFFGGLFLSAALIVVEWKVVRRRPIGSRDLGWNLIGAGILFLLLGVIFQGKLVVQVFWSPHLQS